MALDSEITMEEEATIDWGDATRNMYGCTDCPKCEGKHRFGLKRGDDYVVVCDDCGLQQPAKRISESE